MPGASSPCVIPCSVFAREDAAHDDVHRIVASWVDGYVTGINQHMPDTYDLLSFETTGLILAIVDRHCRAHPDDPVCGVVDNLFAKLKDDRLHDESDKVTVKHGRYESREYVTVLQRVQRRLQQAGLYRGEMDGRIGSELIRSIAAYQESIGFEATGFPDQATLWRLLRGD